MLLAFVSFKAFKLSYGVLRPGAGETVPGAGGGKAPVAAPPEVSYYYYCCCPFSTAPAVSPAAVDISCELLLMCEDDFSCCDVY